MFRGVYYQKKSGMTISDEYEIREWCERHIEEYSAEWYNIKKLLRYYI
jgi:hypothetical protein